MHTLLQVVSGLGWELSAWATILAQRPGVARYARKAGRPIPVALLAPGGTIAP